jgi:uncharacterized repeat protein (TIGR01451 family)
VFRDDEAAHYTVAQPRIGSSARAALGPRRGSARRAVRRDRQADYVGATLVTICARRTKAALASALALCVVASIAGAQPTNTRSRASLELATRVEKIVAVDGADAGAPRTQLVPAGVVAPGDKLVLTVTFANMTTQALDGVRITQPIPPNMRYVDGSAIGPGGEVLYSVDGGASYGQPNELKVVAADGTRRAATADDYTHIRWLLEAPLESGARGFARFRAIVRATPAANAAERSAD